MEKAVKMHIGGIKCDNPNCDFVDMSVKFEDYDKWLNKPCPKCGQNLLTKEDYENTKFIIDTVNLMNTIFPPSKDNLVKASIEMDGTGKIDFKINDYKEGQEK